MSMQEELAFLQQTDDLRTAFLLAKETRDTDYEGYRAAKLAWSEHRSFWRGIREWFQAVAAQEGN